MHSKNQASCISPELVWASSLMVGHSVQYNAMFYTDQQGEEEFSKSLFHTQTQQNWAGNILCPVDKIVQCEGFFSRTNQILKTDNTPSILKEDAMCLSIPLRPYRPAQSQK